MVQDPIRSKVTREVAQIARLVWKTGKRPMLHRFVSKVKQQQQQEVLCTTNTFTSKIYSNTNTNTNTFSIL